MSEEHHYRNNSGGDQRHGLLGNLSQSTGKKIGIIVYMKRVYYMGYRRIHLKYVFQTILYTWNGIQ